MNRTGQPDPQGRVLVVEDDPDAARFVVSVLRGRGGFDVIHTADPAAALNRVSAESWDLVLTDVEMPGMTGLEMLESLRRVAPDLPVAVVTAHATLDNAVTALRSRADEFLDKPLLPDRLLATVTALVAKGRAVRMAGREVVLAIGAHPDDVEIGAGGTLIAHRRIGHDVTVLTLSRGGRGGAAGRRAEESETAARILGAELYLEDLEDSRISEGDPTIGIVSAVVDSVRPTVIYTHSIQDVHQDHRNTHHAAMVAAREVGRILCFQSPSATVDFRPTRFVSIDQQLERKLQAIGAFSAQAAARAYLEPDLIQSTARYWSRFGEGRYAEAFEVIRDGAAVAAGHSASAPARAGLRYENQASRSGRGVRSGQVSDGPARRYGSRSMGQVMHRGPPRPRPSSLPRMVSTSIPFWRR
jgi:LmbE family N-acetylglucosaminyl deacetylase/ActR/RegA family two-component response regulator